MPGERNGQSTTAILGGSFNPIHYGHLHLAAAARAQFGYQRILLVPAHIPPHKAADAYVDAGHRLAMVRLAVAGVDGFEVDACELERGGVSYTIDTVRHLERRFPHTGRLGIILGDDLAVEYHTWREAERLAAVADLLLGARAADSSGLAFRHQRVRNVRLGLSSMLLRDRIRTGDSIAFLTPPPVLDYIRANRLYQP